MTGRLVGERISFTTRGRTHDSVNDVITDVTIDRVGNQGWLNCFPGKKGKAPLVLFPSWGDPPKDYFQGVGIDFTFGFSIIQNNQIPILSLFPLDLKKWPQKSCKKVLKKGFNALKSCKNIICTIIFRINTYQIQSIATNLYFKRFPPTFPLYPLSSIIAPSPKLIKKLLYYADLSERESYSGRVTANIHLYCNILFSSNIILKRKFYKDLNLFIKPFSEYNSHYKNVIYCL